MGHLSKTTHTHRGQTRFTSRWSLLLLIACLISFCFIVRMLDGLQPASAEKPSRSSPVQVPPKSKLNQSETQKVVAVVNRAPVHRVHLARECLQRHGKDVLESIVNKQILLEECKRRGVKVSEQEVEEEINRMAGRFNLSIARWLEMLESERKIKPQQYRSDIVWPTLALRKIASKSLQVTEQEMQQAWHSQYGEKRSVRIIIKTQLDKAELLHRQIIANPGSFASLAMDHSEDKNSAPYGGMIPPIRQFMGNDALEKSAFGLQPGEISPVIPIANQFVIVKCEKHIPPVQVLPEDVPKVRERLAERIRSGKQRTLAAETMKRLQDVAKIENVFNDVQRRKQFPAVAAIVNGQQITMRQLAEESILRHGIDILDIEINRRLLQQELSRRKLAVTQADVDREIERAARAFGIIHKDGTADLKRWLAMVTEEEEVTTEIYIQDIVWPTVALKKLVGVNVQVTIEDLRKGFEANYGPRVECLAIVISNQRQAHDVWKKAKEKPTDENFGKLASVYSIEPVSHNNEGKVPPIARHSGQPQVEKVAFGLKAGEISGILVSEDRYIILRCLGRTKPITEDFAAVRKLLYDDLLEKKLRGAMSTEFNRLKETAQIDNFLAGKTQSGKKVTSANSSRASQSSAGQRDVVPATATAPINNRKQR